MSFIPLDCVYICIKQIMLLNICMYEVIFLKKKYYKNASHMCMTVIKVIVLRDYIYFHLPNIDTLYNSIFNHQREIW